MSSPKAVVGRLPCGCIMAAVIPNPRHARDDKHEIRRMIADGLRVDITTVDAAREEPGFLKCVHGDDTAWKRGINAASETARVYAEATANDETGDTQ